MELSGDGGVQTQFALLEQAYTDPPLVCFDTLCVSSTNEHEYERSCEDLG